MALPKDNLDDRNYQELVTEAIARIPVYAPSWTDHNAHDPGITLIELFAWLTEMQLYRLNRLSQNTRIKLLRLVGIECLSAQPAAVILTFNLLKGTSKTIKAGTQVAAVDPVTQEDIVFETDSEISVTNAEPVTVRATQYQSISEEFSSSGLPILLCELKSLPVVENTLAVRVRENYVWNTWHAVKDFDASKPGDRHYVIDAETGVLTFGNGLCGKIPPKGDDTIYVEYRAGGGERGNVPPGVIRKVLDSDLAGHLSVNNERAACGGTEAETLEQAIHRGRKELNRVVRAVTSADYEHLVLNTPGVRVARVKAIPGYHRNQPHVVHGIVTVVVIPEKSDEKPLPDSVFIRNIYRHLDKHRILTTEVFVIPPEYIEVSIVAVLEVKREFRPDSVRNNVDEALRAFLDPVTGWKDGSGWPFGRSVYISEIYEVIEGVEGVDFVTTLMIKSNGVEYGHELTIPAYGLVCSGQHEIT